MTEAFCVAAIGRQLSARIGQTVDVVPPEDPFREAVKAGADLDGLLLKRHKDLALLPESVSSRRERRSIALSEPYHTMLSDELEMFCAHWPVPCRDGKAISEIEVYDRFSRRAVAEVVSCEDSFLRFVREVNGAFAGGVSEFRAHEMYTRRDARGCRSRFASAADVRPYLSTIRAGIENYHGTHRAITAAVSMIAFTAIHPFNDANGRTSRLLYNWLLNSNDLTKSFFDLKSARSSTEVSFSIKMRRAVAGDWRPLLLQIYNYYEIELQSRNRAAKLIGSSKGKRNACTY